MIFSLTVGVGDAGSSAAVVTELINKVS